MSYFIQQEVEPKPGAPVDAVTQFRYYAGFEDDKPVMFRAAARALTMTKEVAEKVLSQLTGMGHTGYEIVPASVVWSRKATHRKKVA